MSTEGKSSKVAYLALVIALLSMMGAVGNFIFSGKSMGVKPTQLTENRKNRSAKLFRILTCEMCMSDTHGLSTQMPGVSLRGVPGQRAGGGLGLGETA